MIANLSNADLEGADLTGSSLQHANLTDANCARADFSNADLQGANLAGAYLVDADLTGADLNNTRLWEAILYSQIELPNQYDDVPVVFSSVGELLNIIRKLNSRYTNSDEDILLYFRGEYQNDWKLRPSVMRNDGLITSEDRMLTDLISQRPEEFDGQNLAISQWVLAQHYGLNTRFLDITRNPLVALFHACEKVISDRNNLEYNDQHSGRLHIFAIPSCMIKPFNSDTISVIANFAKLSQYERDALVVKSRSYPMFYYRTAMRELYQLIQAEKPHFATRIEPIDFYRVFVVEPQRLSERIRAQSGAFLVSAFHQRFEREEILEWNEGIPVYAHYTLTIPHDCKEGIIQDLRLFNITHETLFPGLDSSADQLRSVIGNRGNRAAVDKVLSLA